MEENKNKIFTKENNYTYITERLSISLINNDNDYDILSSLLMDKDVYYYFDTPRLNLITKNEYINYLKSIAHCALYFCIIKLKESNKIIGMLDYYIDQSNYFGLGYFIGKEFQKKGYATEACIPLTNLIFENLDQKTMSLTFKEKNLASKKLAIKIVNYINSIHKNWKWNYLPSEICFYKFIKEEGNFYYFETSYKNFKEEKKYLKEVIEKKEDFEEKEIGVILYKNN